MAYELSKSFPGVLTSPISSSPQVIATVPEFAKTHVGRSGDPTLHNHLSSEMTNVGRTGTMS